MCNNLDVFDLVVTVIGDVECAFEVASVDLLDVLIISLRPIPVLYVHFFNTNHRHHCIVNHLGLHRTAWYSLYTVPTVLKAKSTGTPKSMHSSPLGIPLACLVVMSTLIFQKSELLSREVGAECDSRDAEAGKGALEAVEAGEGACVPPLFTT
jgi:hypothetical protein